MLYGKFDVAEALLHPGADPYHNEYSGESV